MKLKSYTGPGYGHGKKTLLCKMGIHNWREAGEWNTRSIDNSTPHFKIWECHFCKRTLTVATGGVY